MVDDRPVLPVNVTVPTAGIPCLNCGEKCEADKLKLFQGVGVCEDCYTVADLILRRGRHELELLMTMMQELVRTSLVEGNLHLPRGSEPPSKAEVLGMIITMKEAHERRGMNRNGRQV